MGWFGKKRDPQDPNEMLRQYHEAEAARLAAMVSGRVPEAGSSSVLSADAPSTEFTVEDVFTITGRGIVATGQVVSGALRVGDRVDVLREGLRVGESVITGIEMFRKRVTEATPGTMVGLVLQGKVDVARGDVIRIPASA
ncbi:MAG: EF-Tu/IF-2/RF-3 family GTPase [Candidatus Microbacterium colombiense]|nr:MAG: EF-Tu/IF-2/RF-3 family GTPase [Microbacterium sp.]